MFTLEVEGLGPLSFRFEKALRKIPEDLQAVLETSANNTIERAKILAGERLKNPGSYLDCFYISASRLEVMFGNIHPAARWIEFGTAPHVILPVRRKALRFEKEGAEIFAKRVLHPGTQELWILSDAFREELTGLMDKLKEVAEI